MNTQAENSVSKISKINSKISKNLKKSQKVQMKMIHQVVISGKIFFDPFKMHSNQSKCTLAQLISKSYSAQNLKYLLATCSKWNFTRKYRFWNSGFRLKYSFFEKNRKFTCDTSRIWFVQSSISKIGWQPLVLYVVIQ